MKEYIAIIFAAVLLIIALVLILAGVNNLSARASSINKHKNMVKNK